MEFNLSTFLLEIVNFLILVWILKHFFYQPVRKAIDARRQGIEKTLADAKAVQTEADALKKQYESRLTDWEAEKQAARKKLQEELSADKARQMEALKKSLTEEKEKNRVLDEKRRAAEAEEIEREATRQAAQFAARLLGGLADADLNGRLANVLVTELGKLPEEKRDTLQKTCAKAAAVKIVSAFPLEAQKTAVTAALDRLAGKKMAYEFAVDPKMIAGVRVSMGAYLLQANIEDELRFFAEAASGGS